MTILTAILGFLLALAIWGLFSLWRRYVLVRHLFIRSSDWCANRIDEMTEGAAFLLHEFAPNLSPEDARAVTPFSILDAKKDWGEQADEFQGRLIRNRIAPLGKYDLDDPCGWGRASWGLKP